MSSKGVIDLRNRKPAARNGARVFSSSDRPSPLRQRRRRKRLIILGGVLACIALLAFGVHALSYHERLRVQEIAVEGAVRTGDAAVRSVVEDLLDDPSFAYIARDNIFVYPNERLARAIEASIPGVKRATVQRESLLSQTVRITIEERSGYALWCIVEAEHYTGERNGELDCFVLDDTGYVFADDASVAAPATSYVFSGGVADIRSPIGQSFAGEHLKGLIALLGLLHEAGLPAKGVHIETEPDFNVELVSGYSVKASYGAAPHTIVKNLELVLASESLRGKIGQLEYIDLRFGNRVYYKLKGAVETAPEEAVEQ